eukprot:scaffold168849_cov19-Tisochrysis_lutea.AAC.4
MLLSKEAQCIFFKDPVRSDGLGLATGALIRREACRRSSRLHFPPTAFCAIATSGQSHHVGKARKDVMSSQGHDVLKGSEGHSVLKGSQRHDALEGLQGHDVLKGSQTMTM